MKNKFRLKFKYKGTIMAVEYMAKDEQHARSIAGIKLGHSITDLKNVDILAVERV